MRLIPKQAAYRPTLRLSQINLFALVSWHTGCRTGCHVIVRNLNCLGYGRHAWIRLNSCCIAYSNHAWTMNSLLRRGPWAFGKYWRYLGMFSKCSAKSGNRFRWYGFSDCTPRQSRWSIREVLPERLTHYACSANSMLRMQTLHTHTWIIISIHTFLYCRKIVISESQ